MLKQLFTLFDGTVPNKLLDTNDVTTSRPRKLQNSINGLQQFGKLIARVFLLQIFSCICHCFECIIKQLLDTGYAYHELSRPPSMLSASTETDLGLDNSWYHAQPHPIIVYYCCTCCYVCCWGCCCYCYCKSSCYCCYCCLCCLFLLYRCCRCCRRTLFGNNI